MIRFSASLRRPLVLTALALGVLAPGLRGVPTAAADPAPPRSTAATAAPLTVAIVVQPFGTKATAKVTTSLPTVLTSSTRPVGAAPAASPVSQATAAAAADTGRTGPGSAITAKHVLSAASYVTTHEETLAGLTSNTRYEVTVVATTQDGQSATATATFTTLKQRVRVTLREINITDDGDWFGNGEPLWLIGLDYKRGDGAGGAGVVGACFPVTTSICQAGSYSEGRFFPRNSAGQFLTWTFAEENFDHAPDMFHLGVEAQEWDFIPGAGALADFLQECNPVSGCGFTATVDTSSWTVPQGMEWASTNAILKANDSGGGLHSTMTFTYELFYDSLSYPAMHNTPSSTWR